MTEKKVTWVVYLMTIRKSRDGMKAVCEQSEWEALELARPGYHQLLQSGIASEVEAETIARFDPNADPVSATRAKLR